MEDQFTAPVPVTPPHSGTISGVRRFWHWLRAVVLRLETPSPAAYAEVCRRLEGVQADLLATQTELARARAQLEAAKENVTSLAGVVARDRARVKAETAGFEAASERSIAAAGEVRRGG